MSTARTSSAPGSSRPTGNQRPAWLLPAIGVVVALIVLAVGYALTATPSNESLPTSYGRRRGTGFAPSASGTAALAEMFKAAGYRVQTFTRLSPKLKEADVIVWAPDDFEPPGAKQREFLENWLDEGDGRVVVYIGRDYDSAAAYWNAVLPTAPGEDASEVQRRLARAKADYSAARAKVPVKGYARWFTAKRDAPRKDIRTLQGPWADGIDAKKCEIVLAGRLDVPAQADKGATDAELPATFEPLLTSEGDNLAFRVEEDNNEWGGGQVIVVVNGSWLLNYPLVNHEHRKLAARLVNECGSEGKVAFVESHAGGPPVLDKEPADDASSPLAFMDVWPLNAIIIHLTVLGILFCLARSPIFGRPRELPPESSADFGKHVAALGDLLARTKDQQYALARLQQYRELAKRDSGKSHLKAK